MDASGAGATGAGRERREQMLAIVVADGETASGDAALLAAAELLIAADGGARWLEAQGVRPHLVVGDFDSLEEGDVARLSVSGADVRRHRVEKDASDAELAVAEAIAAGANRIAILGALGGRLDHEMANVLMLVDPDLAGRDLRVIRGRTLVRGIRGKATLDLESDLGGVVTLLPAGGDATGVSTGGLRYSLRGEDLAMGRSRGLSNEVTELPAWVRIEAGSLLVIEMDSTMEGVQ